VPRIRSERPALDLHHPELSMRVHPHGDIPAERLLGAADIGQHDLHDPNPNK
jgi:cytochrome c oxidase subunit 1